MKARLFALFLASLILSQAAADSSGSTSKSRCDELLPGYIEGRARAQEMVQTYTKQMSTLCSQEQVSELKSLQFSSNLIQMVDNAPPTIDALSDGSMLAQVGEDKCKLVYLLITSNQRRVESLENTIEAIRAQCQASSCAAENTRLLSKIAAIEAEMKANVEHAQKEKAQLESEKANLQSVVGKLTQDLKSEKSEVARVKGLLDEMSSNHNTCQSNVVKVKHLLDACNRNHETSQAGYNECKLQIQKVDGALVDEKKELSKCLAREQVVLKEKAVIEGHLQKEVAKNLVCEEKALCTGDKKDTEALKGDLHKCNGKVAELTGQVHDLKSHVQELDTIKGHQSKEISLLVADVKQKTALIASQSQAVSKLKEEVHSLSSQVTNLGKDLKTATDKGAVCETHLQECAKKHTAYTAQCDEKLSKCQNDIHHCDKSKADLVTMYDKLIKDNVAHAKETLLASQKIGNDRLTACHDDAAAAARLASDKLKVATSDLQKCAKDAELVNANLAQCKSSHDQCQNSVDKLTGAKASLESQVSALKTEIKNMEKKHHGSLSACENNLADVKAQLASSQATLTEVTKERNSARSEAENLRKVGEHLEEKLRSLSSEILAANLDLKNKLNHIKTLERELTIETEGLRAATNQTKFLRHELEALRAEIARDLAEIAEMQKKYDSLTDKSSKEATDLKAKIESLQSKHAKASEALKEKEELLATRVKELAAIDAKLKARNEELQRQLDIHSQAVIEVEKLKHSLATVTDLKNQAVKDLSSRTALADELQKKVDSLTLSLQSCVDAKNGAAKECKASISSLTQELNTVQAAHKLAAEKLEATKASLRDASLKLDTCTADVINRKRSEAEVLSQLSKCQSSEKECSTNHKDSEQKLSSCTKQNSEFRQMIKDLSAQHTSATSALLEKLAHAEADAKVFNQRLLECRSQLSTASSEVAARGVALSQKQKQIDSLQDALTTTSAQKESLSSQIASRVKQITELEELVKSKQTNIQALMKDLAAERDANSASARTLTAQIRQLKMEIEEHQAERKRLAAENLSLNHEYKQAVKKIAQLVAEADALKAEYKQATDKIAKLESNAHANQAEIARMTSSIAKYTLSVGKYQKELDSVHHSFELIKEKMSQAQRLFSFLVKKRNDALALAEKYKHDFQHYTEKEHARVKAVIEKLEARVHELNAKLERADGVTKNLQRLMHEHEVMIEGLKKIISKRPTEGEFREVTKALEAARGTIKELKARLRDSIYVGSDDDESSSSSGSSKSSKSSKSSGSSSDASNDVHDDDHHVEINVHDMQALEKRFSSQTAPA